jgi:hypothetical protein
VDPHKGKYILQFRDPAVFRNWVATRMSSPPIMWWIKIYIKDYYIGDSDDDSDVGGEDIAGDKDGGSSDSDDDSARDSKKAQNLDHLLETDSNGYDSDVRACGNKWIAIPCAMNWETFLEAVRTRSATLFGYQYIRQCRKHLDAKLCASVKLRRARIEKLEIELKKAREAKAPRPVPDFVDDNDDDDDDKERSPSDFAQHIVMESIPQPERWVTRKRPRLDTVPRTDGATPTSVASESTAPPPAPA